MKRILSILLATVLSVLGQTTYWVDGTGDLTNSASWTAGRPRYDSEIGWIDGYWTNGANFSVTGTGNITCSNLFIDLMGPDITKTNLHSGKMTVYGKMSLGANSAISTSWVRRTSGTLVCTNAAGTGKLVVGETGFGQYMLTGGTVIVDNLIATNAVLTQSNLTFILAAGNLTTKQSAIWTNSLGKVRIGSPGSLDATWNVYGSADIRPFVYGHTLINGTNTTVNSYGANMGTNGLVMQTYNGTINLMSNSTMWIAAALGFEVASSALGNYSKIFINNSAVTNGGTGSVGNNSSYGLLMITNSGIYSGDGLNVGQTAGVNNKIIITDPGSLFSGNLSVGASGTGGTNQMYLLNGGRYYSPGTLQLGYSPYGSIVFDGANTTGEVANVSYHADAYSCSMLLTNGAILLASSGVAISGATNSFVIAEGSSVTTPSFNVGAGVTKPNNSYYIRGSHIATGSARIRVGYGSSSNTCTFSGPNARGVNLYVFVGLLVTPLTSYSNRFDVLDGASVTCQALRLGYGTGNADAAMNRILVSNAAMTNSAETTVGEDGYNNTFTVRNGGQFATEGMCIGCNYTASNNSFYVDNNSRVDVTGANKHIYIGQGGANTYMRLTGNSTLNVDNGNIYCGLTNNSSGLLEVAGSNVICTNASYGSLILTNSTVKVGGVGRVRVKAIRIQ